MAIKGKYKLLIIVLIIIAIGIVFYTFILKVKQIGPGYVGVKSSINSSNTKPEIVKGYVAFIPLFTDLAVYPTTIQNVKYERLKLTTKDGIAFMYDPSISYQLDETKVQLYYMACRNSLDEVTKSYLKELVLSSYGYIGSGYTSDSLINNQLDFENAANVLLSSKMDEIGLNVKNAISNLETPEKIKEIVDLRAKALHNSILATDKVKQAEAEARVFWIEANTIRVKDSMKHAALTPLAIQQMFIEKWDGKLPNQGDVPQTFKIITQQELTKKDTTEHK